MLSLCQKAFTIGTLRNVITAVNDSFDTALGGLTQAALSGCGLCPRVCEWQYQSSMHVVCCRLSVNIKKNFTDLTVAVLVRVALGTDKFGPDFHGRA